MTTKKRVSFWASPATRARLGQLARHHGTQTEAIATAIDRLYTSTQKERTMDGGELYQLFAQDAAFEDIARQDLASLTEGITELRADADCNIPMTDAEIAEAIWEHAKEHVAEFGE